jgi:hypothetical protein
MNNASPLILKSKFKGALPLTPSFHTKIMAFDPSFFRSQAQWGGFAEANAIFQETP